MKRHSNEEINIFNFSFLDILSCTIGALIFILLMIVLSTANLVEKKIVDEIKEKHAEAKAELSLLEKSLKEINTKPSVLSLNDVANSIITGGGAVESTKTDLRQIFISSLEKKTITVAEGQIYLGESRQSVSVSDIPSIEYALKQFLRYYDGNFEQLYWTRLEEADDTYNRALIVASSLKNFYAQGLKAAKENSPPDYYKAKEGKYAVDLNNDGRMEILYVDNDGDNKWDIKYVNTDQDAFWEEIYIDYDFTTKSWRRKIVDTDFDNTYDLLLEDTMPGDNDWEVKLIDPNLSTNKAKERYEDNDNNGVYDIKLINIDFKDEDWEQSNSKYDAKFKKWKVALVDMNGDGDPDVMWGDTDMNNVDWEEKFVDQDSDGKWDVRYRDLEPRDDDWEALYSKPILNTDFWREVLVDTDGDGAWDKKMIDEDGDGEYEKVIRPDS